jgi:dephospho-CoA kinase
VLKVGLTGNIAAGKSSVAEVWRSLGARVSDADEHARRAVEPNTPAFAAIVAEWGSRVLASDGTLDRPALRDIVFRDPEARKRLEAIVHPAVGALRAAEAEAAEREGARILVADIPLLFEAGLAPEFDVVVLVDAPVEERRRRLVEERGIDPEEADRLISSQMPAELKRAGAHVVIENGGSREELEGRAREVWRELEGQVAGGELRPSGPDASGETSSE